MFKNFLFLFLLLLSSSLCAQSLWLETPENLVPRTGERRIVPQKYRVYRLDLTALQPLLGTAPERFSNSGAETSTQLARPMADGSVQHFQLFESPVMAPELQNRYPGIRCYTGRGMEDASATLKCDLGPGGFHAMIIRAGHSPIFIDPYQQGNSDYYVVYDKKDYLPKKDDAQYTCNVLTDGLTEIKPNNGAELQGDCRLRRYRLALACTAEYANFHGGTKPLVLAAMNTTMNRVNGVFENDVAVTMQLVAKNDTLIFFNAGTDPYTNNDGGTMLGQNVTTCNNRIGSANYDIGHVFSTGGGGIAGLGVVCSNGKAQGVTGGGSPVGDPFDIDYVAHEMGHQFDAEHTQNNDCNRAGGSSMEPGSASTIMGYAGICNPNVQNFSDDYFHAISVQQMSAFVLGSGNTCAVKITTGNNSPTVNGGTDYTIPKSSFFALTAVGADLDNDPLTYCWEQMDPEFATMPPVATSTTGPLFRSFKASAAPTRFFPRLQDIVSNTSPTWEVLPSVSRNMRFRVTVRDNNNAGGCTEEDDVTITVSGAAGPFVLNAPNTNVTWLVGATQAVTWSVNGTNAAPINCANVRISLSTDGGFTYPVILANSVPNNGSANVVVPNNISSTCRVKVEAIGNIFFDISNTNFVIQAPPTPTFLIDASPASNQVCANTSNTATYTLTFTAIAGFNAPVNISVTGAPVGATVSITPSQLTPNGTATCVISNFTTPMAGNYNLSFLAAGGSISQFKNVQLSVLPGAPSTATTEVTPANGAQGIPPGTDLVWRKVAFADIYTVEIATSPSFAPASIVSTFSVSDTTASPNLLNSTVYYWRVKSSNLCGTGPTSGSAAFQTSDKVCGQVFNSTDVPKVIDGASVNSVISTLNVPVNAVISDINVKIKADHTYVGDLSATLSTPWGQDFILFSQPGVPADQFGCGDDNLDLVFDDEASLSAAVLEGTCVPTGIALQGTFQPIDTLGYIVGGNASGDWQLEISDNYADDGGSLTAWSLDFCFPAVLPPGIITTNLLLSVPSGGSANVDGSYLSMQLSGTSAQGRYTLLTLPTHGTLRLSGIPLTIGSVVTQAEINNGLVSYLNNGDNATTDQFRFDALDINNFAWVHDVPFNFIIVKNNLSASATQTAAVPCNNGTGGQITVTASGLNGTYTYSINGGAPQTSNVFTGLAAGTYTVVVTGQFGFTASSNAVILSNPTAVSGTSDVVNDVITLTANGGASPYQYSIDGTFQSSNTFTGVPNGVYAVTIQDANGCTGTVQAIVAVNTLIVNANIVSDVLCAGGDQGIINVTVGGGSFPYTYSLNNGPFVSQDVFTGLFAGAYTVVVRDNMGFEATTNTVVLTNPAVLNLTATTLLNTLTASASGGTAPYQYSIDGANYQDSGVFTNLTNGTYSVSTRDANGCVTTKNAVISIPALTLTANNTIPVTCFGGDDGVITAFATGGIPPYQYIINMAPFQNGNVFSGLTAGIYNILVRDAIGTQVFFTVNVNQPDLLTVVATNVTDNEVALTFNGGTGPFTYTLNDVPGAPLNNLNIGNYTVLATDAKGCTATTNFEIFGNTIVTQVDSTRAVSCFGENNGKVTLCVDGGYPPITLAAIPGATVTTILGTCDQNFEISDLVAGNYSVEVADSKGYTQTINFSINEPDSLILGASVVTDSIVLSPTGGTGPYEFSMNAVSFQSSNVYPDLSPGTYVVQVVDANGCIAFSEAVVIVSATIEPSIAWGLQIAPNPSTGWFQLRMETAPNTLHLQVQDMAGRILRNMDYTPGQGAFQTDLDLQAFPQGIYMLRMTDGINWGTVRLSIVR